MKDAQQAPAVVVVAVVGSSNLLVSKGLLHQPFMKANKTIC